MPDKFLPKKIKIVRRTQISSFVPYIANNNKIVFINRKDTRSKHLIKKITNLYKTHFFNQIQKTKITFFTSINSKNRHIINQQKIKQKHKTNKNIKK